jgi:DNA polymerase III epsilon subunit-like protein
MYLFFDTETNGLPKDYKSPPSPTDNWPRVIQLAYALYDSNRNLIEDYVSLIKPDGWEIPLEKFWIDNGYSTGKNEELGVPFVTVSNGFVNAINQSQYMIAHNMDFDYKIVASEFMRYGIRADSKPSKIRTMKSTTSFCALPGKYGYKWPKLEELHEKIFGVKFDGAHDALEDVKACARCFFDLMDIGIITPTQKITAL